MNTSTQATDNELIQSFQQGSNLALETLVNRHKDKIFTSISLLVEDSYLAEDLFQDVFIKIIDTLRTQRYNDEGKFLPWAMRIAHNICLDHFRKVKRIPTITNRDEMDTFDVIPVKEQGSDPVKIKGESEQEVRQILELLPMEQREVIVLRHYADMSFKEIAAMTRCSINTALGRMRYGLLNMKKLLTEKQVAF